MENLTELNLIGDELFANSAQLDKSLRKVIAAKCPNLQRLILKHFNVRDEEISFIIRNCQSLKTLKVTWATMSTHWISLFVEFITVPLPDISDLEFCFEIERFVINGTRINITVKNLERPEHFEVIYATAKTLLSSLEIIDPTCLDRLFERECNLKNYFSTWCADIYSFFVLKYDQF